MPDRFYIALMVNHQLLAVLIFMTTSLKAATLDIKFTNLRNEDGVIHYLLFKGSDGFPDDDKKSVRKGTIDATETHLTLKDLEEGDYAFTVIHDENNNGKLDTFMGIPKEGFGFSNTPTILFGPPSYKKSSFSIRLETQITLKMKYM